MHKVICKVCGKTFDRDKEPFVQVAPKRYAHKSCVQSESEKLTQEQKDKNELDQYIMKLFRTDFVEPRVQKQIAKYKTEYNYTYSGMLKALKYFYEIKGNSLDKANGGVGIIPYIYKNAFDYYYSLWQAQQKNTTKVIENYVPEIKEITIQEPQRIVKKRRLFCFLDKE